MRYSVNIYYALWSIILKAMRYTDNNFGIIIVIVATSIIFVHMSRLYGTYNSNAHPTYHTYIPA